MFIHYSRKTSGRTGADRAVSLFGARSRHGGWVLWCLLVVGCGQHSQGIPAAANPSVAREALTAGLDAWKSGQRPEVLKGRQPAVHFTDLDWDNGGKLEAYQVQGELDSHGQSAVATVALTLTQPDGKSQQIKRSYSIDTGSTVVIVPAELTPP